MEEADGKTDPLSRELERFLTCRHLKIAYNPKFRREAKQYSYNALGAKGQQRGAAGKDAPSEGSSESYREPLPLDKPLPTRNYKAPTPQRRPVVKQHNYKAPVPKQRPAINFDIPLDAMIRGVLISLENSPNLGVTRSQLSRIAQRLPEYKKALNSLDQNPSLRNATILGLTKELMSVLTQEQLAYIAENDGKTRIGLMPSTKESAWARELQNYVEAKSAGRQYRPTYNIVD